MSAHRHRPGRSSATASTSSNGAAAPDLFHMLLPNAHTHIPKGAAAMWERHHQQQQQQSPQMKPMLQATKPAAPTRPHSSSGVVHSPSRSSHQLPLSPRHLKIASPQKAIPLVKSLTPRCKSADPCSLSLRQKRVESRSPRSSQVIVDERLEDTHSRDQQDQPELVDIHFPLDVHAREHVEMKACLLAYKHRIDVEELQRVREHTSRSIDDVKARQLVARGGILDDGSLFQTTKRKTSFLLRHFFALGEPDGASVKQERLLHDVIDEWSCRDDASSEEIATLWKSIMAHIEHSYVLRRQLVPTADPDALSITIAMDCLRKLPAKLPDYRRILDVIITLVERGLHLPSVGSTQNHGGQTRGLAKRFYFEECHTLRDALNREAETRRARLATEAADAAAKSQSPLQQLQKLLEILKSRDANHEREALLVALLQSDLNGLVNVALRESLQFCFDIQSPRNHHKQQFYKLWMPLLRAEDARNVLMELTTHHLPAFQTFFHENFDAMDKLLMETLPVRPSSGVAPGNSTPSNPNASSTNVPPAATSTLFQKLIERHPTQFASVLWASPYLTAHVFQDSHHLITRILEQNIVLISTVLQQRPDVLLALFNHTLRDSATVLEEFLLNHPKAFSDLLLNRGPAIATAVKSHPSILADILQASRSTLAKVLLSMPELLCHLFKSTPELLAQTIREDLTILPLAFSMVPQSLSDALERHPEYFADIAHRKPMLVTKLFSKYPDLLLEPLEANPSVFSNFLVFHRKILPDFSDPGFDPSFFQFERKKFVDCAQQTDKRLCKYDGKLRLRERIKLQEDEQLSAMRQAATLGLSASASISTSTNGRSTPVLGASSGRMTPVSSPSSGRMTPVSGGERVNGKDARTGSSQTPSPSQVVSEIARLYVKKIESNAQMDALGKKRRALADFALELYIQELGFKRKAQKKLTLLLAGANQAEQESLRIKWFLKFMNAAGASVGSSSATTTVSSLETAEMRWTYHPLASDFYLTATHFLVAQPSEQLLQRLDEELLRPCLVGYTRLKQFLEDPIMARMLSTKEQRQQLLAAICEKESLIHGAGAPVPTSTSSGRSSSTTTPTLVMLHLEDVLESLMLVWIQFQDAIRGEWTMQFQLANPDGSGVMRYSAFADLIRTKLPALDDRAIMKIYHQCEEENDLGEFFLVVDDFSLAMSILQEQNAISQFAPLTLATENSAIFSPSSVQNA